MSRKSKRSRSERKKFNRRIERESCLKKQGNMKRNRRRLKKPKRLKRENKRKETEESLKKSLDRKNL